MKTLKHNVCVMCIVKYNKKEKTNSMDVGKKREEQAGLYKRIQGQKP